MTCGATPSPRACTPHGLRQLRRRRIVLGRSLLPRKLCSRIRLPRKVGGDVRLECLLGDWPVTMPVLTSGTARQRVTEDGHLVEPRLPLHRRVSWHHAVSLLMPRGSLAARSDRVWMQVARVVDSAAARNNQVGVGPGDLMVQEPRAAVETTAVAAVHQRPVCLASVLRKPEVPTSRP